MRKKIVVICPTTQALIHAADWLDGQFVNDAHAQFARRAIGMRALHLRPFSPP
jgi:hypothetical protein